MPKKSKVWLHVIEGTVGEILGRFAIIKRPPDVEFCICDNARPGSIIVFLSSVLNFYQCKNHKAQPYTLDL